MRLITEQASEAFHNKRNFNKDNTSVTYNKDNNSSDMYLFSNHIARIDHHTACLTISNGGWLSNTTKERLNGLNGVSVRQKNGEWFLNNEAWNGEAIIVNIATLADVEEYINANLSFIVKQAANHSYNHTCKLVINKMYQRTSKLKELLNDNELYIYKIFWCDWFNNFLTVDGYASHYDISVNQANKLIKNLKETKNIIYPKKEEK